jgi:hypothetical protein
MTKKQYFDRCKNFDWYYDFADDYFGIALPGKRAEEGLIEAYMCFPEWKSIYEAWHDYAFSGDNWGIDKKKKPAYTNFEIKEDEE